MRFLNRAPVQGVLCKPAPTRGVGSSSRTGYTPSTISTLCIAHQRATKALASVASAKQIARALFTTPRVLDGIEIHPSAPQLASNHAFI
jgi:hypothetical protein